MGFFDKMFEKKECAICGTELGLLGKTKINEGYLCKECAGKLSPYFHGYRSSTADDIREQLAYREANAERLASFNPTRTLSAGRTNIMLDEDAGLLIITSQSRWRDANPDIIEFSQVLGCDMDIDEHRTEIYRETKDGERESYNPPRYDLDYDFNLTIHVNTPYFTEINLRVNDSTIDQRGSIEYREAKRQATEVRDALVQLRQETRDSVVAAKAPKTAVTCPFCGATTIPDASGRCEYCGGAIGAWPPAAKGPIMAFESVNYQCPACGGPLHFASAEQKLVCDYCDSRFEVEEVEALYRERQDKADAAAAAPKPAVDDAVQELAQNAGYICSSCGAELISDGTVAVTTCPYCGNPAVAPGQLSGDFSPDLVIPFKLGRDDVTAALKEHYKGKILLPKSFVTGNHIDEVQGVYVPFWLYGARVDGEVCFDATNETVTEESDRTVTTTDHYDAYRKGNISFERVPVDGSSKMPDGHMDAIEPFDYDALRPFSVAYMPGYIANRYDEDCETCKARAERRMEESTISALRETVVDEYDDATVESKQLDYTWEDSDYALFPVWMLSTS